jgi:preprotein translocase subunit YajC
MKLVAILALCAVMYFMGYSHEHKKFVKYQAEIAALGKAQEIMNAAKVKEHETISTSIANQYEARLSAVHSYYADRVQPNPSSGNLPTVPKPTNCPNAASTNTEFIRQCAETTLMLTELQNWVRSIK